MVIKNIHEKLLSGIQTMLIDTRINLPFYGEFNLHVNFHEQDNIGTCAVNMTSKGMNFFYSPKFLENMSQKETNFIILHEDFHLLFDHPKRTVTGLYDHKLSNIVQDMIINHIIWEDIPRNFVEIPKSPDGKNMALFVPKEYTGKLIFEELYEWMKNEKEKWEKAGGNSGKQKGNNQQNGQGGNKDNQNGQGGNGNNQNDQGGKDKGEHPGESEGGDSGYGPYGKSPSKDGETIDTWSKEKLFEDLENGGEGQYLDKHIDSDIPEEMRNSMVKDVVERLKARGLSTANIEQTLNKLQKKRKDYLKEIKRSVSNMIFGHIKERTITKPNRKSIQGLKGNKKIKSKVNVILDTSGSMGGTFERVLNYVYRNDIEINMIQGDTEVKWVENFKNSKKLESMKISGLGGTILQPSVDYVVKHFNQYNTVVLTDGYTDTLDLSKIKGRVLMISIGVKVPVSRSNNKVKQIVVDVNEK